jgi:hypothetical protein
MILGSVYSKHCPFSLRVPKSVEHLFAAFLRLLELWASLLPASSSLSCAIVVAERFGGAPPAIGYGGQWHYIIFLR